MIYRGILAHALHVPAEDSIRSAHGHFYKVLSYDAGMLALQIYNICSVDAIFS